ncbi:MAG: hypothetical protein CL868_10020 [Cytophagaceae bacterium]|nr:hypothetical protein [Cytophagaceae bacterium]|tara:strand:+ start:4313 stop:4549 length:237 start_codon:yes stop_codon:yes gene_type:complete
MKNGNHFLSNFGMLGACVRYIFINTYRKLRGKGLISLGELENEGSSAYGDGWNHAMNVLIGFILCGIVLGLVWGKLLA